MVVFGFKNLLEAFEAPPAGLSSTLGLFEWSSLCFKNLLEAFEASPTGLSSTLGPFEWSSLALKTYLKHLKHRPQAFLAHLVRLNGRLWL
jgi:hypothetical protein